ncbi:class F sortase [Streptomyces sp. NBC_01216]|uniref:class F sortase n=1 Tax=unclassified Streptomyces TaxID=2593676 RepID=UPI002E166CC9|nr:class F sortase [Streptomyces sp. NBC_01216]
MASEPDFHGEKRGRRRRIAIFLWTLALGAVAVLLLGRLPQEETAPGQGTAYARVPPAVPSPTTQPAKRPLSLSRSAPVRIVIPRIGVDAPFTDLAIGEGGHLDAPPPNDTNLVGWHADGPSPGEIGTAIVAGHVDTKTSAAVFAGLSRLTPGDRFDIRRADGRTATFAVDTLETFSKEDFPNDRVYADTDRPLIRLITCAGVYDKKVRDYKDNLVVFAHLADAT